MKDGKAFIWLILIAVLAVSGCTEASINDVVEISGDNVDWTAQFSPDIPYYNMSESMIDVRSGPGADAEIIDRLSPGDGGFIENCGAKALYCQISYGGHGATGRVDMSKMGGYAG